MTSNFALAALLALSTPALASFRALPAQATPPSETQPLRAVAVVHGGDAELIEKLKRVGELWHDAGPFVVAALSERDINVLRAREIEIQWLAGLAPTAELFVVDLAHADVRRDIDAAGRIEFVRDGLALVSVPRRLAGVSREPATRPHVPQRAHRDRAPCDGAAAAHELRARLRPRSRSPAATRASSRSSTRSRR
jgi:hypothetical protein